MMCPDSGVHAEVQSEVGGVREAHRMTVLAKTPSLSNNMRLCKAAGQGVAGDLSIR